MAARLEDLKRDATVKGILPDALVTVVDAKWHGNTVLELVYRDAAGTLGQRLVYRDVEPTLEIVETGRAWSFDGDGELLRLASEAYRINLAYLFDPHLAIHTSLVEPFPHQITAVYEEMLLRQPLRFLLADDPGAGKTIMAGLLIKELLVRGDLHRCMIVSPGNLVEQWQDELRDKFRLHFEILTKDKIESAASGNWFQENPLAICRLDKLSRDEAIHAKLLASEWDLIVCDEAHKMSARFFGGEVKFTKRYRLGQLLSGTTRHFLLLTATPHNGKEEDFQLFMALIDGDRFEGRFRDGVHAQDPSDLMRRLVKEKLLKFDGTPLFPERRAYTVGFRLSDGEAALYKAVTDYVREEFNRAEALENDGRKGTVGFALTILQRRLASSPEAIYQSLRRRRERLEERLREAQLLRRGGEVPAASDAPDLDADDIDEIEDAPGDEQEETEERVVDSATAARTIAELQAEIDILTRLEALALKVRASGVDRKWDELSKILQNTPEMFDSGGARRKLVLFTEHRDTLNYLAERIRGLIGKPEAVVTIYGGMGREQRKTAEHAFTQDKDVEVLVATDAAGEGINLQRAHLMVNYDLPWNPNRLEQRFGRIHRIGQAEVCHLWNLVAEETREGDVYALLLRKLEKEREALGGGVFDVLGTLFRETRLRDLLLEAVRYGDLPETKAKLVRAVEGIVDRRHLEELLDNRALIPDTMDARRVFKIKEEMERAEALRLQPHFIADFFLAAFEHLGGSIHRREPGRYEITRVPAPIRTVDRAVGRAAPLLPRYERVTFEKSLISLPGKPTAEFVCPGHPLLDATSHLVLERYRDLLRRGAVLVCPGDESENVRALCYLEHAIQDARKRKDGGAVTVSKRMQFVEIDSEGRSGPAGAAPYLDCRPIREDERLLVKDQLEAGWLSRDLEGIAVGYAVERLVPEHLQEVRERKEALIKKTKEAVKDRLTKEINYWDNRAHRLKEQEEAGKQPRMNWRRAQEWADNLSARLRNRERELEQERMLSPLPPVAIGGALIVPEGLLRRLRGERRDTPAAHAKETAEVERLAMDAVMAAERALGYAPRDVSAKKKGWDIESSAPEPRRGAGSILRFLEVKGRIAGANTVTVTKQEILKSLNKPQDFILAIVTVENGKASTPRYVRRAFKNEPDFHAESITFSLPKLLAMAEDPA